MACKKHGYKKGKKSYGKGYKRASSRKGKKVMRGY